MLTFKCKKDSMLPWEQSSDHSIFYYLLLAFLILTQLQALGIGGLFFFKRSGDRRSNAFYGILLIFFSLTLLHYILIFTGLYQKYQGIHFIPIYFTLSLPVFFFFHIKLNLFPQYQLRWTDFKHFLLPLGQVLFFMFTYFSGKAFEENYGRQDGSPFYGAFEQFLYLVTFFAYLYFSYRYVIVKKSMKNNHWDAKKVWYSEKLIQVFFLLFCVHTLFVLSDYFAYQFFQINLKANKVFAALGIISFAALLLCLGTYGFQVLIWGRKLLNAQPKTSK